MTTNSKARRLELLESEMTKGTASNHLSPEALALLERIATASGGGYERGGGGEVPTPDTPEMIAERTQAKALLANLLPGTRNDRPK